MQKTIEIDNRVAVGGQPTSAELQELAHQGFKTVVNLRTANEENQPLKPEEEGKLVEQLGMKYLHIPVSREDMNQAQVAEFRDQIEHLPAPRYVHCATGRRAGAFAMMHMAVERGMSGSEVLERAERMGFQCDNPKLKEFVKNYVDKTAPNRTAATT